MQPTDIRDSQTISTTLFFLLTILKGSTGRTNFCKMFKKEWNDLLVNAVFQLVLERDIPIPIPRSRTRRDFFRDGIVYPIPALGMGSGPNPGRDRGRFFHPVPTLVSIQLQSFAENYCRKAVPGISCSSSYLLRLKWYCFQNYGQFFSNFLWSPTSTSQIWSAMWREDKRRLASFLCKES